MSEMTHVDGKNVGKITLYALSTCAWCKKARILLDELKVEYFYTYVDLLNNDENNQVKEEIKEWNPRCTFPTLVINEEACIIGFDETKIRDLAK